MDRTTLNIIGIAAIVLTLIGGLYLSPSSPRGDATPTYTDGRVTFSKDDVRYDVQQEARAELKKRKGKPPPPESEPETFSDNEAPSTEEESMGEDSEAPPLE